MDKLRYCGLTLLLVSSLLFAQDFTPQKQYEFSRQLFEDGKYSDAIIEFNRYLTFFPGGDRKDEVKFLIGLSSYLNKDSEKAIEYWESAFGRIKEPEYKKNTLGFLIQTYIEFNKPLAAGDLLERYASYYSSEQIKTINLWIEIVRGNFKNAVDYCKDLGEITKYSLFYEIESGIGGFKFKRKSPLIAGLCSVIPGGGYFYLNRPGDGGFIFIVNSLFMSFFAHAVETKNLFLTIFWGGLETGWYTSGIYGSVRDAKKHNVNKIIIFIERLKKEYLKYTFREMEIISDLF